MFVIASGDSAVLDRWRAALGEGAAVIEIRRYDALLECLEGLLPQIMLLDLRLTRACLLRDIAELRKASPDTRIIAFADECDEDHELALFRAGVRGICVLNTAHDMLPRIVSAVAQGELWIRRHLVPKLLESVATVQSDTAMGYTGRFAVLTPREIEITRLIGQGVSNKRIARHLAIAERTVKGHLTAIFRKIGVVDRLKLALLITSKR